MKPPYPRPALRSPAVERTIYGSGAGGETYRFGQPTRKRRLADLAASWRFGVVIACVSLATLVGCQSSPGAFAADGSAAPASFITLEQLATALTDPEDVMLIEFCMPSGCSRCDAMREPIDRLASGWGDGLSVRRIDLGQHPQLTWEFKLNACPTYVAFRGGREVFRAEHPTSVALIAAKLDESLGEPADEPLAAVTR